MNIFVDVLETVVAHATDQEPGADVFVLINSDRLLTLGTTISVNACEMAGELALVFGNESPLGELFSLCALQE